MARDRTASARFARNDDALGSSRPPPTSARPETPSSSADRLSVSAASAADSNTRDSTARLMRASARTRGVVAPRRSNQCDGFAAAPPGEKPERHPRVAARRRDAQRESTRIVGGRGTPRLVGGSVSLASSRIRLARLVDRSPLDGPAAAAAATTRAGASRAASAGTASASSRPRSAEFAKSSSTSAAHARVRARTLRATRETRGAPLPAPPPSDRPARRRREQRRAFRPRGISRRGRSTTTLEARVTRRRRLSSRGHERRRTPRVRSRRSRGSRCTPRRPPRRPEAAHRGSRETRARASERRAPPPRTHSAPLRRSASRRRPRGRRTRARGPRTRRIRRGPSRAARTGTRRALRRVRRKSAEAPLLRKSARLCRGPTRPRAPRAERERVLLRAEPDVPDDVREEPAHALGLAERRLGRVRAPADAGGHVAVGEEPRDVRAADPAPEEGFQHENRGRRVGEHRLDRALRVLGSEDEVELHERAPGLRARRHRQRRRARGVAQKRLQALRREVVRGGVLELEPDGGERDVGLLEERVRGEGDVRGERRGGKVAGERGR